MTEEWKDRSLIQMNIEAKNAAINDAFLAFGSFKDEDTELRARSIARASIGQFLERVKAEAEARASHLAGEILLEFVRQGSLPGADEGEQALQAARAAFGLIEKADANHERGVSSDVREG